MDPAGSDAAPRGRPTLAGHFEILRIDHWFKNVFAIPGVIVAISLIREPDTQGLAFRLALAAASLCLIASSNYVLNEILDGESDRAHPTKAARAVPSGRVSLPLAWAQWLVLMVVGLALGWWVSPFFAASVGGLWLMAVGYNVPPLRTKDVPYLDVLTESINNPLRLMAGWYAVDPEVQPPGSLQLSYWMAGAYFMAVKRYAEFRLLSERARAAYRASFAHYTEERLLTSTMFYAASAMLFFGIFIVRYRLELILSFPLVALVMAVYLNIGLKPDSPAQRPEQLYREPTLMVALLSCAAVMIFCLWIDMPWIADVIDVFPRTDYRAP